MRVLLQRARAARALLDGEEVAAIGRGLVAFVGLGRYDTEAVVERLARKVAHLRVFDSPSSQFGRSLLEEGAAILTLSQFTLYADTSPGRRPSFSGAAPPELAGGLYRGFGRALEQAGVEEVVQGPFQRRLVVEVTNWGPFTLMLEQDAVSPVDESTRPSPE
jgi:D-tyrosyl-tRNA(Tyr) deacylase